MLPSPLNIVRRPAQAQRIQLNVQESQGLIMLGSQRMHLEVEKKRLAIREFEAVTRSERKNRYLEHELRRIDAAQRNKCLAILVMIVLLLIFISSLAVCPRL